MARDLYVFDLDRTLIKGNGSFRFCFFLVFEKFFAPATFFRAISYYIRHRFFSLSLEALHHEVFNTLLEGKSLDDFSKFAERFWDRYFSKIIKKKTLSYLQKAKEMGHHTVLLSSSPDFLVKPFAKRLFFDECKGTGYALDKEGQLESIFSLILGKEKRDYALSAKVRLGANRMVVLTDSIADLPLIDVANDVILVDPDKPLLRYSKNRELTII